MTAYAPIRPSESFSLEFSTSNSKHLHSLIALDNIILYPSRFCRILECSFDDIKCRQNLFSFQELPEDVWTVKNLFGNFYLNADFTNLQAGKKSFYGFPIVRPVHEKMCVRFKYLIKVFAHVRVIMVKGKTDLKAIWHQTAESKIFSRINKKISYKFKIFKCLK